MAKANPPKKKFKVGRINTTVWLNENGEKGPYYSINFDRRYKDGDDWKTVTSFSHDDLTDLIAAAEMARSSVPILKRIEAAEGE